MEGDAPANTLVLALVEGNAEDNSFLQEFIAKDLQCIFRGFDITLPLSVTELCDSSASTSAPSSVEPVAASTSAPSVEPVAASTCAPSVPAGKSKRKSRALPRVEPVQVNAHNIPQCWCSSDNYLGSIECEHCHRQFHPECVGIDDVPLAKSNHWQCLFCCEASVPVPSSSVPHVSGSAPELTSEELKMCNVKNMTVSAYCPHCATECKTRPNLAVPTPVSRPAQQTPAAPTVVSTPKPTVMDRLTAQQKSVSKQPRAATRGQAQYEASTRAIQPPRSTTAESSGRPEREYAKLRVTAVLSCDGKAVNIFCGLQKGNIKYFCPKCLVGASMEAGVSHAPGRHLQDESKLCKPRTSDILMRDLASSTQRERDQGVLTHNQQHMPVVVLNAEEMICPSPLHYDLGLGNNIDDLIESRLDKKLPEIRKLQLEARVEKVCTNLMIKIVNRGKWATRQGLT